VEIRNVNSLNVAHREGSISDRGWM